MKRKEYILLICLLSLSIIGCNNNNVTQEPTTQEYDIETPSVDIQNDNDNLSSFYTNFVIQDDYRVYTITEKTKSNNIAIPNWQSQDCIIIDTADIVNDFDDKMSNITRKRIDFLKEKLKPSGMIADKQEQKNIFMRYKTPYIKKYTSDYFAIAGQDREKSRTTGIWQYSIHDDKEVVDKYNIVCMSVNMYEDFYNCSNSTKLLIYGIPEDTFESNLKMDINSKYQFPDISAILEKYHNGVCELKILTEVELTKSGNYYMDFSEIIANDEYKDIIIEMELTGEITDEYTYVWYGFGYKIDNEQIYQNWKVENANKFIY